jgi:transcriptional regulator with XRE-family HTH domain
VSKGSAASNHQVSDSYTARVRRVRRGLTTQEVAEVVSVQPRQVQHWASGSHRPQGQARERLLELDYIIELLSEVYDDEGVEIWLHGKNRSLDGSRPIDLLVDGEFQIVLAAVERLASGAM